MQMRRQPPRDVPPPPAPAAPPAAAAPAAASAPAAAAAVIAAAPAVFVDADPLDAGARKAEEESLRASQALIDSEIELRAAEDRVERARADMLRADGKLAGLAEELTRLEEDGELPTTKAEEGGGGAPPAAPRRRRTRRRRSMISSRAARPSSSRPSPMLWRPS